MNIDIVYKALQKEFSLHKAPIVDLLEIQTKDPFKVLIATILSARTNDKTTSVVIEKLFSKVQKVSDLKGLSVLEIEQLIFPVGFYRQKAKYLKKLPFVLEELFDNKIPEEIDELCKLPGVGRKTANLVRAVAFKKPAICVDIHVHRICNRLGYVKTKTPFETEMKLREILPQEYWITFNSYLVSFGQNHCKAINPMCSSCVIYDQCKRVNVKTKYKKEV